MGLAARARLLIVVAAAAAAGCDELAPAVSLDNLGQAAPLSGPDIYGRPVALSDFKGKVVLVNFWATWCPGCRQETPDLEKLYEKKKGSGFSILGVSVDEDYAAVAPFMRGAGVTYPVLQKPGGPEVRPGWRIPGLPCSFLVSRDGTIVRQYAGVIDPDSTLADVKAALAR